MLWVGANINCHRYEHGGQATATWAIEGYTRTARVTPNKLSVGGACISSLEVAARFAENPSSLLVEGGKTFGCIQLLCNGVLTLLPVTVTGQMQE
jgi:hypothetical protein